MVNYTFSHADEVISVYGRPILARRKTLVRLREVQGDRELLPCSTGDTLEAIQGLDYVVTPETGLPYPYKKDIFHRAWELVPGSKEFYRRNAPARVIPIPEGHTVALQTLEGPVTASHPDYIALGIDGEVYTVSIKWANENLDFTA